MFLPLKRRVICLMYLMAVFVCCWQGVMGVKPAQAEESMTATCPPKYRVLVINSYHHGFWWTDDQLWGLQELVERTPLSVDLRAVFLDSLQHDKEKDHFDQLAQFYAREYAGLKIDVIVATDTPALEFAIAHRETLAPHAPIVFCGLCATMPDVVVRTTNITGVIETMDSVPTLQKVMQIHPQVRHIWVIQDDEENPPQLETILTQAAGQIRKDVAVTVMKNQPAHDNTLFFSRLSPEDNVIMIRASLKHGIGSGQSQALEALMEKLRGTVKAPVYFICAETLSAGTVGGSMISGRKQGLMAAGLVYELLNGTPVTNLPIRLGNFTRFVVNYPELVIAGRDVDDLPEDTVVINQPFSFYRTYRYWVWSVSMVIIILTLLLVTLLVNIARRRKAEASVRASEQRLRAVISSLPVILFVVDKGGRFTLSDGKGLSALGFKAGEMVGRSAYELYAGNDSLLSGIRRALEGEAFSSTIEIQGRIFEVFFSPVQNTLGQRSGTIGIAVDITERQQAERQLVASQKMEAIGNLAGGIAHDFNNMLTGILGYAAIIKRSTPHGSPLHDAGETIEMAAGRAAELTRQLLDFARQSKQIDVAVNINDVIHEVIALLGRTIEKSIEIKENLYIAPVTIHGDPSQIQQVVLNLAINARDAMPNGGRMMFETRIVDITSAYCRSHPDMHPGRYVSLAISDTGHGIPQDIQSRIFEPFFTTKEAGKGTGMGLAMVYSIIKSHGASIDLVSEVGKGTTFTILLPYFEGENAATAQSLPAEDLSLRRGTGRILIVDDEDLIRLLCVSLLKDLGYEPLVAVNGQEAIDIYRTMGKTIDLAIIDVAMPEMDGYECFKALKAMNPNIKALLSSGYNLEAQLKTIRGEGLMGYIQKPYKLNEMAQAIDEALKKEWPLKENGTPA